MKASSFVSVGLMGWAGFCAAAEGQTVETAQTTPAAGSPPLAIVESPRVGQPVFNYEQKQTAYRQALVTPEQSQSIIDKFKEAYAKLGNPRMVIYVNQALWETNLTLADRQTMRDMERLFGRPLRMAGASLTDQQVAIQLLADQKVKSLAKESEQARKGREVLAQITDVAIELLVSSKHVPVTELSGDRTYLLPDIQATAIKLSDSKVLAQASSADVMRGNQAYFARNYGVEEVAEATALALMEDMLMSVPGK